MRAAALTVALSLAVAAWASEGASPDDTARVNAWVDSVKQAAGLVRQLVAAGKQDLAVAKLGTIINDAGSMREALQAAADGGARGARSEELASATEFDTGAAFSVNTTFKPKRCSGQLASPGHRVRIHYVGKFVHDSKVFASSFHTGSVPYRMVLGDPSELEAWNVGIEGMCPNERRSIVSPWNMAYGAKGNAKVGVPPKADVKFFIELVSVSERPAPGFSHLAKSRSEDL